MRLSMMALPINLKWALERIMPQSLKRDNKKH